MSSRLTLAIVFSLLLPSLLPAQLNRRGAQGGNNNPQMQPTDIKGVIQDVGKAGLIVTESTGNKTWRVFTSGNLTKLHVTGSLSPTQLKTGMLAEITADFDDNGKISKPVEALTVTTLGRDKQPGVFPGGAGGGAPMLGGNEGGKKGAAKGGSHGVAHPTGTCRVVGRLSVGRAGNFTIQAGRQAVGFKLSADAKIDVDVADYSLVTRGSNVSVTGMASPAHPGYMQATEVNVELSGVSSGMDGGDGIGAKATGKKAGKKKLPAEN